MQGALVYGLVVEQPSDDSRLLTRVRVWRAGLDFDEHILCALQSDRNGLHDER